jgi:hypothetical protein
MMRKDALICHINDKIMIMVWEIDNDNNDHGDGEDHGDTMINMMIST